MATEPSRDGGPAADVDTDDGLIDEVAWDDLGGADRSIPWVFVGFVLTMAGLYWGYRLTHSPKYADPFVSFPTMTTWVFRASLVSLVFLVVPPLVRNRRRTRAYWEAFKRDRLALAAAVYLALFFVLGAAGPALFGRTTYNLDALAQPPVGFSIEYVRGCAGPVVGSGASQACQGTWAHPLGTGNWGQEMWKLLVMGMRVSLQMAVVASAIMIPLATVVGVTAGYVGGLVDDLLMGYVEVQQAVPAFVVYLVSLFVWGESLLLLVIVFGLLNWGSVAKLVRAETRQRRNEPYVEVAKNAGVGHPTIVRRHVLPNVSNAVFVGATQKIPQLVLVEAGLSFIGLGDSGRYYPSFGQTINKAIGSNSALPGPPATQKWWVWLFPVVVLVVTVVALSVVGDRLRDVLDPREAS